MYVYKICCSKKKINIKIENLDKIEILRYDKNSINSHFLNIKGSENNFDKKNSKIEEKHNGSSIKYLIIKCFRYNNSCVETKTKILLKDKTKQINDTQTISKNTEMKLEKNNFLKCKTKMFDKEKIKANNDINKHKFSEPKNFDEKRKIQNFSMVESKFNSMKTNGDAKKIIQNDEIKPIKIPHNQLIQNNEDYKLDIKENLKTCIVQDVIRNDKSTNNENDISENAKNQLDAKFNNTNCIRKESKINLEINTDNYNEKMPDKKSIILNDNKDENQIKEDIFFKYIKENLDTKFISNGRIQLKQHTNESIINKNQISIKNEDLKSFPSNDNELDNKIKEIISFDKLLIGFNNLGNTCYM